MQRVANSASLVHHPEEKHDNRRPDGPHKRMVEHLDREIPVVCYKLLLHRHLRQVPCVVAGTAEKNVLRTLVVLAVVVDEPRHTLP
jgi:hypothetical protein